MSSKKTHLLNVFMNQEQPSIVKGKGIYLYGPNGERYIDASGGPILSSLGHGVDEMADALAKQARELPYVFRMDFTTPIAEKAADVVYEASGGVLDKIFFVSGGSEATEISVKLARKYQIDSVTNMCSMKRFRVDSASLK